MTSDQLVAWVERKLEEHGVRKVVPDDRTLTDAYQRMARQAYVQKEIDELIKHLDREPVAVPDDVRRRIDARLAKRPESSWDRALRSIVTGDVERISKKPEPNDDED